MGSITSFTTDASSECETSVIALTDASSDIVASTQSSSFTTNKTRKRKLTANTWEHARKPQGLEPERCPRRKEKFYYCKYCISRSYSTTVSTTFRNHLLREHNIELESGETHPVKKACNNLLKDAFAKAGEVNTVKLKAHEQEVLKNSLNRKAAIEALVQLVTVRNLPYNISQWPEFHAFIATINPAADHLISLSHGSIQKLVSNSYSIYKDILRKKLQATPSLIHLSADVWTSPNRKAFLGVCAQFVNEELKKTCQALLALPELPGLDGPGSHSGAEQFKLLERVIEDYNVSHKIGYVTGDNHGSNDVLCRLLSDFLRGKGKEWKPKDHRIRCHGHIINLAIQAFLFTESKEAIDTACRQMEECDEAEYDITLIEEWKKRKSLGWRQMGPLGKVHNTCIHIRADNYRYNLFKDKAGRVLCLDNDTRWNSWYLLLDVVIEKQEHVEWYQKKYYDQLKDDYLTPQDWLMLKNTRSFLQPFWKATQRTQDYCATLDQTLFTMDILVKHYNQAFEKFKNDPQLLSCILTSWHVFDKYYMKSDETPAYAAALILHPSRRKAYILKNWPKSWHRQTLSAVKRLWDDSYKGLLMMDPTPPLEPKAEPDEYDLLAQELDVIGTAIDIDEYEAYISQTPIQIDCSPLTWWLLDEQRQRFPRLSKMAVDILSIPAMSADPERVFSGARRTITWERVQLGASTVEKGECLKSWIRSGVAEGVAAELVGQGVATTGGIENLQVEIGDDV